MARDFVDWALGLFPQIVGFGVLLVVMMGCKQADVSHETCLKGEMHACERSCLEFERLDDCDTLAKHYQESKNASGLLKVSATLCENGRFDGCARRASMHMTQGAPFYDETQARQWFTKGCDGEDAESCAGLGRMMEKGLGGYRDESGAGSKYEKGCAGEYAPGCAWLAAWHRAKKDFERFREAATKACDLGEEQGCNLLGVALLEGLGGAEDKTRALALFEAACAAEVSVACANAGSVYFRADGVSADLKKAREYLNTACEAGEFVACNDLGVLLVDNDDAKDVTRGRELFAKACAEGQPYGCLNAGVYGTDPAQQRNDLRKACEAELPMGCLHFGEALRQGLGGPVDEEGARSVLQKACDARLGQGCVALGLMTESGEDGDIIKAMILFEKACEYEAALCLNAVTRCLDGSKGYVDAATAARLCLSACERGVGGACYDLAELYRDGNGVEASVERAYTFYSKACELDYPAGCSLTGACLLYGKGVEQDATQGVKMLERACALEDAVGCSTLGSLYERGELFARDLAKALSLYEKACGYEAYTCAALARCYREGVGVEVDLAKAEALTKKTCAGQTEESCQSFDLLSGSSARSPVEGLRASLGRIELAALGQGGDKGQAVWQGQGGSLWSQPSGQGAVPTPSNLELPAGLPQEPTAPAEGTETELVEEQGLSKDEVRVVIRGSFAQIRKCNKANPGSPAGKLEMRFMIEMDGSVSEASVESEEYAGSGVAECVLGVVQGLKFPPSEFRTPVNYPFAIN
ncbi:MAG: AgmX/PglI C-terminal domain-containing protein [Myxococcota bacterium]|jgi:TPR repeat protein|nr:AgmX/PglI C-terminal domain-containing protein [Myxococcota bacterium]